MALDLNPEEKTAGTATSSIENFFANGSEAIISVSTGTLAIAASASGKPTFVAAL